jgi:hypothetical protein
VKVAPIPKPNISPGGPLSLCAGDSAGIDAGAGFARYYWSSGDTTRKITVRETGEYRLMVISNDGCIGFDTLNLIVHPLPPVPTITRSGDTLIASGSGTYRWTLGNTPLSSATGSRLIALQPGDYTVMVIDSNGCAATSAPFTVAPLGVAEQDHSLELRLLPGEKGRWLVAGYAAGTSGVNVEVVDIRGAVLLRERWQVRGSYSRMLSLENLPAGAYFIRVSDGGREQTGRVIKE